MLAVEDKYNVYDIIAVDLMYRRINKIIDNLYLELNDLILKEIIDNINRNADLLFNIADVTKKINYKNILINPNTKHSISFELKRNKTRLKNNIKRAIENSSSLDEINKELKRLVYNKVYGKTNGDGAKTLRIFRTEYTRTRTQAKLEAVEELQKEGYEVTRHWLYTYEAKVPRPEHLASDGMSENNDGYFIINGYKTKGPGLFGIASEDINCRCDTECFITERPHKD